VLRRACGEEAARAGGTGVEAVFDVTGFNGFVRQRWLDILAAIAEAPLAVLGADSFQSFLEDAASEALTLAAGISEHAPLGCRGSSSPIIDPDEDNRLWFDLAVALNRAVIGRGAGLLGHFFELVNPPPYVAEVRLTQDSGVSAPPAGGDYRVRWDDVIEPAPELTYYINQYSTSGFPTYAISHTAERVVPEVLTHREFHEETATPLLSGLQTRLAVRFGPNQVIPKSMARVSAAFVDSRTDLRRTSAGDNGEWWTLDFHMPCHLEGEWAVLEVSGRDVEAHLLSRASAGAPIGDVLDHNPATVAYVSAATRHEWVGYEPGSVRFRVPVHNLPYLGLRAVTSVFDSAGSRPTHDSVAEVWRGVDPDTAAVLNQGHDVTVFVETDVGPILVDRLTACVDLAWHIDPIALDEAGRPVDLEEVGLVVHLERRGVSAAMLSAMPSDRTPLGTYRVRVTVRGAGLKLSLVLPFAVDELAEGFKELHRRFTESGGVDGPRDISRRGFQEFWQELQARLQPPSLRPPGCVPSPVTLCWAQDRTLWHDYVVWTQNPTQIERVRRWLSTPGQRLDKVSELNVARTLQLARDALGIDTKPPR
jgi:hypothetical protein